MVHYNAQNDPIVLPLADLTALRLLRLFAYTNSEPQLQPVAAAPLRPAMHGHKGH